MPDAKAPDAKPTAFSEFLKEAETFVGSMIDGIASAAGADDDAPLIASHSGALREQFGKLVQVTRDRYAGVNAESRRVVDEFMAAQSVTTLARNGQAAFRTSVAKGLFGDGIFAWLESHLEEIKKIIEMIWSLFGTMPAWLSKILQIIDQFSKLIFGLLGGIFGRSRSKVMSELSTMEVEFWNELAAHKRYLQAANGAAVERED